MQNNINDFHSIMPMMMVDPLIKFFADAHRSGEKRKIIK